MPPQPATPNAILSFFNAYPSFTYNPDAPSSASEFRRLCYEMKWDKGDPDQKKVWKEFQIALAKQFNKLYGTDPENVKAWQRLCATLDVDPVPTGLKEARSAVLNIHANPVDLIEGFKGARQVQTFSNEEDLAEYSRRSGKLISQTTLGAGPLLQMLLNPRARVLQELQRSASPPSQPRPPNPTLSFFDQYPTFTYNPTAPSAASEFRRLCAHKGWEKGNPDQKVAWEDFQSSLAKHFNSLYGVDVDNLRLWQRLCSTLGIEPIPGNLNAAQEAVFKTHFNLVDLIEGYKGARDIKTFESDAELEEYSRREGKIISKSCPAAGALLKALMRRTTQVNGSLNAPLKSRQVSRNATKRDKGGKSGKDLKDQRGQGRAGAVSVGVEDKEGEKTKAKTARNNARKMLVMCSVERSGAFLDYDDEYASDF